VRVSVAEEDRDTDGVAGDGETEGVWVAESLADSVCVEEGETVPLAESEGETVPLAENDRVEEGVPEKDTVPVTEPVLDAVRVCVTEAIPQVSSAPPPGAAHVHTAGPGPYCTVAPLLASVNSAATTAPSAPRSCSFHPLRFATVSDTPFTEPPPPLAPPSSATLRMACGVPPRTETSHGAAAQGWQPMQPPREPAAIHSEAVLLSKARAAHRAAFAASLARHPQLPLSVLPLSAETEAPAMVSARLAPLAPHTCSSATAGMERTWAAPGQLAL
jgi:hypothetical protein